MSNQLRILALVLLVAGATVRSPLLGAAAFILAGATFVTAWWTRRVERGLRVRYTVPATVNYGDEATVTIEITNTSLLPIPWLQVTDSVPLTLRIAAPLRAAFGVGAGATRQIMYRVRGSRRGLYRLGPLRLTTGDVLGLYMRSLTIPVAELTVFPRVMPLPRLQLPAQLPFGPLSTRQRRGEDPARPMGTRPYQSSDGVRRLDWKATARHGDLLVRRAEPSVAPETIIALAFRTADYPAHVSQDSLERAVVAAASLSAAILERKLPVGLVSNGIDAKNPGTDVVLPHGKGDGHLQMLLHLLGRLQAGEAALPDLLARQILPWGGTLALVIADLDMSMLPQLDALRRRGQHIVAYLVEPTPEGLAFARAQGIPAVPVDERGVPMPLLNAA
jgi:uncharacterized repeat protein (TIGR01451 family)